MEHADKASVGSRFKAIWADIKAYRRVYILSAIASLGGTAFGWDTGLIGGVLTMTAFQKSFNLNPNSPEFANLQGNIVSVLQAGCFFGAFASFFISDWFGRKISLLVAAAFFLVGSVMQTCSGINTTSLGLLYGGRVVGGFGVGILSASVPTYIGENANKEIRGRCIGMMQLFNVTGIMLSFFVNYGVNLHIKDGSSKTWRIPFAIQMLPGIILAIGMFTQNESPRWLVEKKKIDKARQALAYVRAKDIDDEDIQFELDEIIQDFQGRSKLSLLEQVKATWASKSIFYPVTMALILQCAQQWTGTNSINYYAPQIFENIGLASTSAGLFATGIYGVVKVVMTGLALCIAIEQLGRKWCLIGGALGMCFSMLYIGIETAVSPTVPGKPLTGASTFAIVCVYLFVASYSFSYGHIPYILSSECSPNHVRSLVMAAALMMQWLWNFIIAKITPIMLSNIGYGTFIVFAVACFLGAVYAAIFVPETKNVPLETLHLLFEGNIVRNATKDLLPKYQRAKMLRDTYIAHETENGGRSSTENPSDSDSKDDTVHTGHVKTDI